MPRVAFGANTSPKKRYSTAQSRSERRSRYEQKVRDQKFDEFTTNDLIEFWADCYFLTYEHKWIRRDRTLCNMIFGQLKEWYGIAGAMNMIMASFQHKVRPRDVTWYLSEIAKDLHQQKQYDHCLAQSRELRAKWDEMHGLGDNVIDGTCEEED